MIMFHEFCRALELIGKSGKNGSKQQNLDSLWLKVRGLQSALLLEVKSVLAERPHTHFLLSPFANAASSVG